LRLGIVFVLILVLMLLLLLLLLLFTVVWRGSNDRRKGDRRRSEREL
jgi:heme/copper-type cytochrome/quinol oxidase subunit 2